MTSFKQRLQAYAAQAETALSEDLLIPELPEAILHEAMGYSLSAGGKRFRPVLAYAVGELICLPAHTLDPFVRALEMIHTYSLIHDDLPAMDDDDLRRGKPTNHKVFGEAMAILAGDALLNRAYEVMLAAAAAPGLDHEARLRTVSAAFLVSEAAGAAGMVGGQVLDMLAEQSSKGFSEPRCAVFGHLRDAEVRRLAGTGCKSRVVAVAPYPCPENRRAHPCRRDGSRGAGRPTARTSEIHWPAMPTGWGWHFRFGMICLMCREPKPRLANPSAVTCAMERPPTLCCWACMVHSRHSRKPRNRRWRHWLRLGNVLCS